MSIVLSLLRHRSSVNLLNHPRVLRGFSVNVESQESVVSQFVENLRNIPQRDWSRNETIGALLVSSSPLTLSQITKRLGSYSLAISFFNYLDSKSTSLESLSLTLQSVTELADSRDKLLRLHEIAQKKNIPNPNTIDALFRNGHVDDAFKVVDEMLERGFVDQKTASVVFDAVWRGRLCTERETVGLILRFGVHGLCPEIVWLTRFVTALCKKGCVDVAWEVLSDLMKKRVRLEAPPFNAVLTSLGRRMEIGKMNEIAVKMDEMEIRPDVVTLGIFVNALCKSRKVDEALGVFDKMCDGNVIKADTIHFNNLIDGFCKVGRVEEAEGLLVRMKEERCVPNRVTYNCLIGGYCRAGLLDTAKEVVTRMKGDGVTPDVITLNTIVGGMCKYHAVNLAVMFFTEMEREGVRGNVATYMTLIHAYCKVGNVEKAMQLFDKMFEEGCSPDAKIYYALISGLCQARRDRDVIRVVEKLKQARLAPDLLAYNMLIGLFCDKNNVEKVYELLNDMEGAGMKPDCITYNTLISFFGKQKDFGSVHRLMEEMREDGLIPTVVTYGAIIEAYCSAGETEVALKIYKDMGLHSKVNPNTVIYNILINAFSKLGNVEQALALKEEMKEKMVRPNVDTYNALFRCLKEKSRVFL